MCLFQCCTRVQFRMPSIQFMTISKQFLGKTQVQCQAFEQPLTVIGGSVVPQQVSIDQAPNFVVSRQLLPLDSPLCPELAGGKDIRD